MAEFPTYEEMAKNVAEKALDDFLYNGKSIREWMQIIASEDCISREEVCDYIAEFVNHKYATDREREMVEHIIGGIQHLSSIQPTTKENLVVGDCISRAELLKAVDTWDKFGCDADSKLVPYKDCYVPYIHYDDVVKAIKGMPSIQPKPKTDVLEKIRAEIEDRPSYMLSTSSEWERGVDAMLGQALMIIDKYKAESEG